MRAPPMSALDTLRGDLVNRIDQRAVAARFMVIPERQVLRHIPRRLGANRALDDAVKCICNASSAPLSKPGPMYSDALYSLQKALDHSEQSMSTETLGAATLLQMFEHSVDHAEFRWMVHANGVINMLRLRGVRIPMGERVILTACCLR